MSNISTLLDRARTLATESASGAFTGSRITLNAEFQSIIGEINRQAQSIGMNQGGQFAQALAVFIGGGKGTTNAVANMNGTIGLDLSQSAVDAQSLGLQGVQAVGAAGTDIGTGSAATTVQDILANATNNASQGTAGYTTFTFSGPGFGDSNKISISVDLAGVTDTTTLTTALNNAIRNAGNGTTQYATAFKNANISASTVTDFQGRQQLAFSSSTSAFQVQAGDKMANALLGNFAQNARLQGSDTSATVASAGLSFSSIKIDGNPISLSASTLAALTAGGTAATSGSVSGAPTVSNAAIAALNPTVPFPAGTGLAAGDTLALTVDGAAKIVTFTGGETTLAQIASEITASSAGVTASVSGTATSQQLVLTSKTTGVTSNVSVVAAGTSPELLAANITGFTANTAGTPGTPIGLVSKASIVNLLNSDANFSSVATASLNGNQVVVQSNANTSSSSVQITGSLAAALGFSTAAATAASAATGASLNTAVQSARAFGSINQTVISTLAVPATPVSGSNNILTLSLNGASDVALTLTPGSSSNAAVAGDINTQIAASSLAGQITASVDANGKLHLTAANSGSTVTVGGGVGDTAALNLGFTTGQTSGTASDAFVTSSDNIQVQISDGGMTSPVTLNLNPTAAGVTKASTVLTDLTSKIAGNTLLAGAGISLSTNTEGNNLVFTDSKGEKFQVAVTGDTGNVLGFGSFKADGSGNFDYSTIAGSAALGTTSAPATLNISINGGATTQINVASGSSPAATLIAINSQITTNPVLSAAGFQASLSGSGTLVLTSTNHTNFRLSGGGADLGFGSSGGAYAGSTNSAASTTGRVDSAGAYTTNSMAFTPMANGGDSQTISITATDSTGGAHSLAIPLQNNSTARTGDSIDDALHAVNTSLQQSNDPTLQSIYAVKEDNGNGTESIRFMSTTQNFKVAVSSLSDLSGVIPPTSGISTATQNGAGADVSIDTIAGAQTAVNALAAAVQKLGTAQAAVGKGENNLNYAVNLAQSQLTNEASSESQIRDANLAQQAANLTRAQILMQAGTAALSQANSAPQQLLSLLQQH